MRALACYLAFGFGGSAFAQSAPTPAPTGAPAAPRSGDQLSRVDQTAAQALEEVLAARMDVTRLNGRIDTRKREIEALALRVTALEAANGTTTTTTTAPTPTNTNPPTDPATPPTSGTVADRLEQVERHQGVIREILFGIDSRDPVQVGEALRRWQTTQSGLEAYVLQLHADTAALKAGVERAEADIADLKRGRRFTLGIEVQSDLGTPVEGVRAGMVNTGGVGLSIGQGFGRPDEVGVAGDIVLSTGVGYAGLVSWSVGGRASILIPKGFEVGGEVRVGQLVHGFTERATDGGYGIDTRVTPALYLGFRPDAAPVALYGTVGYGGGPAWSLVGNDRKLGRSSAVVLGGGIAVRFPIVRKSGSTTAQ